MAAVSRTTHPWTKPTSQKTSAHTQCTPAMVKDKMNKQKKSVHKKSSHECCHLMTNQLSFRIAATEKHASCGLHNVAPDHIA